MAHLSTAANSRNEISPSLSASNTARTVGFAEPEQMRSPALRVALRRRDGDATGAQRGAQRGGRAASAAGKGKGKGKGKDKGKCKDKGRGSKRKRAARGSGV
jgi:hypothetical protein